VAVFDSLEKLPAYTAMVDVYSRLIDRSVGEALSIPFSMGDSDRLAALFEAAGIDNAEITSRQETARFASAGNMVLSDVKGWFPFAGIHLDEATVEEVVREAEQVLTPFQSAGGIVEFPVSVKIITAAKT